MEPVFLEIILNSRECALVNLDSRDEIEDPLIDVLEESGLGRVSGGGGGMGIYNIDIDLDDEENLDRTLVIIRQCLVSLNVPKSTRIIRYKPFEQEFPVYE